MEAVMNSGNSSNDKHGRARAGAHDPELQSARVGRRSAKWALSYLRGRSAAYLRGSVTHGNVNGCVELALRYGASLDDARRVLADYGLVWNAERREVAKESSLAESRGKPVHRDRRDVQSTAAEPAQPLRRLA